MMFDPDKLNDLMQFDHVIEVHEDGTVTEPSGIYAPDVYDHDTDNPAVEGFRDDKWELLNGFSGQYSYSGPVMHPSEYIGGGLARYILETPGIYVAVVVRDIGNDDDAGWAVARKTD